MSEMPYGFNQTPFYNSGHQSINQWSGNNHSMYAQPRPVTPMPQQPALPPTTLNNVLRVMGVESAKEFRVGPNSQVILMDADKPVFYLKRSDDSGYADVRAFEFKEIPLQPEPIQTPSQVVEEQSTEPTLFATKDELSELRHEIKEFKKTIEDLVIK